MEWIHKWSENVFNILKQQQMYTSVINIFELTKKGLLLIDKLSMLVHDENFFVHHLLFPVRRLISEQNDEGIFERFKYRYVCSCRR